MDESLLRVVANYWVLSRLVFHFNRIELYPTIEEFGAIIGELEIDDVIFPTIGGDLKRGNLVGLILAETFNGLDALHWKEASFFEGSPFLL